VSRPWGEATEPSLATQEGDTVTVTITCRLVSLADAAAALAVSTRTVRRYIAAGHLEAVRLGRRTLRIKVDSLERFIDARPVGSWLR
jgi:excisionase family DNA binding protein